MCGGRRAEDINAFNIAFKLRWDLYSSCQFHLLHCELQNSSFSNRLSSNRTKIVEVVASSSFRITHECNYKNCLMLKSNPMTSLLTCTYRLRREKQCLIFILNIHSDQAPYHIHSNIIQIKKWQHHQWLLLLCQLT